MSLEWRDASSAVSNVAHNTRLFTYLYYLRTVLVVYLSVPFLLKSSYTLLLETVCIPPLTSLICEIKTLLILWKYQVILVITYISIIKVINYAL